MKKLSKRSTIKLGAIYSPGATRQGLRDIQGLGFTETILPNIFNSC